MHNMFSAWIRNLFFFKIKKVNGNKFTYLCGKISFPLYLVHLNVADFITWYCQKYSPLSTGLQYLIYFIISIIGVIILMSIIELIKLLSRKVNKVIV